MPPNLVFDYVRGEGTVAKLYWPDQPDQGEVVIKLPEPQPVAMAEVERIMASLVSFVRDGLQTEQQPRQIRVGDILIEIGAKQLEAFPEKELDLFLGRIEHYISHFPQKPDNSDLAYPFEE